MVSAIRGGPAMPTRSTLPALDPALQLLLLLARLELAEEQEASARALCARIDDWPGLAQQANHRFVLPLAYRHLRRLAPENLSSEQLDAMKRQSLAVVKLNLLVAAAQHRLQTELLIPLEIPHVFFKGPSLAARYYDDPALRFSRDIDLLVPPERLVLLLEAALSKGYVSLMPKGLTKKREGLAYAAGAHHVFSLLSPDGVPIDLHQQIDCSGTIYATQQLLDGAESFVAGDAEIPDRKSVV